MGKKVQTLLTLVVAIVVWSAPPDFADKRVALVIGNGDTNTGSTCPIRGMMPRMSRLR
jgi:hypothetical protein